MAILRYCQINPKFISDKEWGNLKKVVGNPENTSKLTLKTLAQAFFNNFTGFAEIHLPGILAFECAHNLAHIF